MNRKAKNFLCATAMMCGPVISAKAQTIILNNTAAASLVAIRTEYGNAPERAWAATFNNLTNSKTAALIASANLQMGANYRAIPSQGFRTYFRVAYTVGNGQTATIDYNVTEIPLVGTSSYYAGGSAALLCFETDKALGLSFPRLLLRKASSWNSWGSDSKEYSYAVDGNIHETSGRKGMSILRSSFPLLSRTGNAAAAASLQGAMNQTVFPGSTLTDTLRSILDVNQRPAGQGSFVLSEAILANYDLGFEFSSGYIDGTINASSIFNEPGLSSNIKQYIQGIIKDAIASLGKKIAEWLASLLF